MTEANGLGFQDPQQWEDMVTFFVDNGLVGESLDPSKIFTNDFLP